MAEVAPGLRSPAADLAAACSPPDAEADRARLVPTILDMSRRRGHPRKVHLDQAQRRRARRCRRSSSSPYDHANGVRPLPPGERHQLKERKRHCRLAHET